MKPSVVLALLVGVAIGFGVGNFVTQGSSGSAAPTPVAAAAGAKSEAELAYKSSQMPGGILDGLTDAQKLAAMDAANQVKCSQCPNDTVAKCLGNGHVDCAGGLAQLRQAADLARKGQTAPQIVAALGGAAAPAARPSDDSRTVYKVPVDGSPMKGSADALVTIVEFSDYECPFCGRAEGTMKDLQGQYGNKLRMVMKQNPLPFHQNAVPAALAALAAGEQGKYWEMHDKLFANMKALGAANLEGYAKDIGLDVARWKKDMESPKLKAIIEKDQALARQLGASGTPAFFINGRKISGAQPINNFKAVIDEELTKAEALVKSGTKPSEVYAKAIANGVTAPPAAPAAPSAPAPAKAAKIDVPADSPAYGPKHAKVTIVEWSDFECPFCSRVLPTLEEIKKTYGNDVKIVFRHQPLPFHPNAKPAAEAAMAAHEQGKFWEYHDKLFGTKKLDRASLESHAQELGLDLNKFKAALDSGKYRAKVEADSAEGSRVGANGTPTFFVNGRQVVGAQPFAAFKSVIDEEIAKADKLLKSGVKMEQLYDKLLAEAMAAAPTVQPAAAPAPEAPVKDIQIANAPVKGPKNAPVTIVAFSDFECPFCSRVLPTLKQIEDQYKGKVKIAFKHQPLPFHANAKLAAAASMAANEQGKFWEFHDKLFANQRALDRASLEKYAQELGLDVNKFKSALDSNKYAQLIDSDSAEGNRIGANGTPTFFINGRKVVGAQPFPAFQTVIDEELKKAGK